MPRQHGIGKRGFGKLSNCVELFTSLGIATGNHHSHGFTARTSNKHELAIDLFREIARTKNRFNNVAIALEAFDTNAALQSDVGNL